MLKILRRNIMEGKRQEYLRNCMEKCKSGMVRKYECEEWTGKDNQPAPKST